MPSDYREENAGERELENAAPEDLKQVMKLWKGIVGETQGRFKVVLSSAVPKYNPNSDDQRLFVVFADFLAEPYINNAEKAAELETIIAGKIGKRVEVKMILQADEHLSGGRLSKISVDDVIREVVHAEIEIED